MSLEKVLNDVVLVGKLTVAAIAKAAEFIAHGKSGEDALHEITAIRPHVQAQVDARIDQELQAIAQNESSARDGEG